MTAPLILSLALHPDDQARLDALRREHFPPDRNQLRAHVTMFHAVPGEHLPAVRDAVTQVCRRPPFPVEVTGVRPLGRGTALTLDSPELTDVRAALAREFSPWLTRQDAQTYRAHVTVQNFVTPAAARSLVARLTDGFEPWSVRATGVCVHRYLGGPWELLAQTPFDGGTESTGGPGTS